MSNKVRSSITFSPELLEKIDSEADRLGMNRSAFVAMSVNSYFREKKLMGSLPKMLELAKEVGKINESLSSKEGGQKINEDVINQLKIKMDDIKK